MRRAGSAAFAMTMTMTMTMTAAVLLAGCDNSQAFHRPQFTLSRMLTQPRAEPYGTSLAFSDGLAMRVPPRGTLARSARGESAAETLVEDFGARERAFEAGGGDAGEPPYRTRVPVPVTARLLAEGRARFEATCAACHGILGNGHSVVATKMELRRPPSFHEGRFRDLPPGEVYEAVTAGYGLMPSLAAMLSPEERWAVVAYVDALRLSQAAPVGRLRDADRRALAESAP